LTHYCTHGGDQNRNPLCSATGNPLDRLRHALGQLTNQQKILLMVAVAALVALIVASSTWLKQSDYRILFSNISERDGGAIIAALDQMNVPYKFSDSGSAILIPGSRVHDVRLRLATQGLPKGGNVGFELMENQKFGISQFAEQVNYQRGSKASWRGRSSRSAPFRSHACIWRFPSPPSSCARN
jgi:Flagellar biosynthesis/type III secretory pathway lipoprotein